MGGSEVGPLISVVGGAPLTEEGTDLAGLLDLERKHLASIFLWPWQICGTMSVFDPHGVRFR